MQVRGSTLALKPRTDITRRPKQGYQCPIVTRVCQSRSQISDTGIRSCFRSISQTANFSRQNFLLIFFSKLYFIIRLQQGRDGGLGLGLGLEEYPSERDEQFNSGHIEPTHHPTPFERTHTQQLQFVAGENTAEVSQFCSKSF